MRAECVTAVQAAIGRDITAGEARGLEQRVREAMLAVAKEDPARWQTLPQTDRLLEGAQRAADDLIAEAAKKKQRLQLTILAHDKIEQYTQAQVAAGHDADRLAAFSRLIAGKADGKNNSTSAESLSKGIMAATMGRLTDAWEAIRPGMLGILANREAEEQLVRALHGDTRGVEDPILQAAKVWSETAESLRTRFNAAGGVVGKLDNWGMPHAWSQDLAVKAGKDRFVADLLPLLDRRRYVHEDGRAYTDAELQSFLGEAWATIVTNGANKTLESKRGNGGAIKANRNAQSRQLHFRDAAGTLAALRAYSGRNVFEAMVGHTRRMSRDIALIETFGPNADLTAQHFLDTIKTEQARTPEGQANIGKVENQLAKTARLYDFVAGNSDPPPNRRLANAAAAVRSWLTAAKLGSAAVTSLSDEGTLYLTAKVNRLPMLQVFFNEVRAFNPLDRTEKRLATRAGLLAHTMADEMDRFGTETLGSQIPNKVAAVVMKASGLNALTEARRRAFSVTMMDAIGALTREVDSIDQLDAGDFRLLRDKGITAEEWAVWRAAEPDAWRGNDTVLTPESIYAIPDKTIAQLVPNVAPRVVKERAASKLLAVVLEEQDIAVIEPGARERSMIRGGTQSGTVKGELVRSFFQFKTFPIAMMARHWQRAAGLYNTTGGKAGYIAALMAAQTVLGAVAMEVNDILGGKNPRPLAGDDPRVGRNWLAAVLKGGSLGLYGDFLFADSTDYGRTLLGAVAGPVAGLVEDVDDLTRGNIVQAMRGEETDFGAELTRFVKGYTPGSSLWYAKAGLDRLVFHQLQEYFSPGYLRRAKQRAHERNGTTYWWDPGAAPTEAEPVDVAQAVGQ